VFTRELELYRNTALAGILPAVAAITPNDDGAARTAWGYAFPPHIVVERGESLNEWCSRVQPNFATALFVLLHVAQRLARLHAAGLCHRDLKCDAISHAWQ
jgi:serine/threonine protein kinase